LEQRFRHDSHGHGRGERMSEVWVAAGNYSPNDAVGSPYGLKLKDGVRLYGGFAGTETNRAQRNWTNNVTTLLSIENQSSVDAIGAINRGTVLDGFRITVCSATT